MKKLATLAVSLAASLALTAQSSTRTATYDMTKTMQLKGTVSSLVLPTGGTGVHRFRCPWLWRQN